LSRVTGVGQYFLGLVDGLARNDPTNRYLLFTSSLRQRPAPVERPSNFHVVDRRIPVRVLNALWHRFGVPPVDYLVGESVDLAHSSTPLLLPSRRGRSIVTICDLFFLENPEATSREIRKHYGSLVRGHVERADAILVISETTARDVVDKLGVPREKITVARPGVDPGLLQSVQDAEAECRDEPRHAGQRQRQRHRQRQRNNRPYALTVATLEPRKNIPLLLEAVAQLKGRGWEGRLLVAGGDGVDAPRIRETIRDRALADTVELLGYVPRSTLPTLYRSARALVMPSIWEGFGMPLLEAMAMQVPVVCSGIPVHREVAKEAAEYFDPTDADSIAEAIEIVWSDEERRSALTESGSGRLSEFSWDIAAKRTIAMYRSLC
jgi:glycosyltransferase involved in cell wall biosynthesis